MAAGRPAAPLAPEIQELRALLRRVPDGLQATLAALAARPPAEQERLLAELLRVVGRDLFPLLRAAATGSDPVLAASALRVIPRIGTRAAADLLVEAHRLHPEGELGELARRGGEALRALGVRVDLPEPTGEAAPAYVLRETAATLFDAEGNQSIAARFQDRYGIWHAAMVLWNDETGVKDAFFGPVSRQRWEEGQEPGQRHYPCPPEYARWQVAQARRLNETAGEPADALLREWDELVGPPPADYAPPDPAAPMRDLDPEERFRLAQEAARLLDEELVGWTLDPAECQQMLPEWLAFQNWLWRVGPGREVSDEESARMLEEVRRQAREMFDERLARVYRERLVIVARLLEWGGERERARWAGALVAELDSGAAPETFAFFTGLYQRSLGLTYRLVRQGHDLEEARSRRRGRR